MMVAVKHREETVSHREHFMEELSHLPDLGMSEIHVAPSAGRCAVCIQVLKLFFNSHSPVSWGF